MNNSQYHLLVDKVWNDIEEGIEQSGADIDFEQSGNVFTLDFADGSQIILNRQEPKHEIWLASKSGGYHFVYQDDLWVCTKTKKEFFQLLKQECSLHAGEQVDW